MKFGKRLLSVLLALTLVFTSGGTLLSVAAEEASHEHTTVNALEGGTTAPPSNTTKPSEPEPPVTHTHVYGDKPLFIETQPTCTEKGSGKFRCTVEGCHNAIVKDIPALGHNPQETGRKDATCEENGIIYKKCSRCDYTENDTTSLKALGHDWDNKDYSVSQEATCTEKGEMKRTCKRCGKSETKEIAAKGHNVQETGRKAATCEEYGTIYKKCTRCNYTENDTTTLKPLGHHLVKKTQGPSCTEKGKEWEECDRDGCSYSTPKKDTDKALGHDFSVFVSKEDPTCTKDGKEIYKCSRCDKTEERKLEKLDHTEYWKVIKEPTCETKGSEDKYCSVCGEEIPFSPARDIDKLGHKVDYDHGTITTPVSCTQNEITTYKCTREGCAYTEPTITKNRLGHDPVLTKTINATCMVDGKKIFNCSRCGLESSEIIPHPGHKVSDWHVKTPATCVNPGVQHKECTVCGEEQVSRPYELSPKGHTYGNWVVTEPTYDKDGKRVKTCTRSGCNATITETIPKIAKDHTHDEKGKKTTIREATCTENGLIRVYCSHKGCQAYSEKETIPTGHKFGSFAETQKADCINTGVRMSTCKYCGATQTETTPPLGHSYGEWTETRAATSEQSGLRQRTCEICGDIQMEAFLAAPEESVDLNATLPNGAHGVILTAPNGKPVNETEKKSSNRKKIAAISAMTAVLAAGTAGAAFFLAKKKKGEAK